MHFCEPQVISRHLFVIEASIYDLPRVYRSVSYILYAENLSDFHTLNKKISRLNSPK